MAGLDSLQADDLDMGGAGEGVEELDGEVEDMDLSSTMGERGGARPGEWEPGNKAGGEGAPGRRISRHE